MIRKLSFGMIALSAMCLCSIPSCKKEIIDDVNGKVKSETTTTAGSTVKRDYSYDVSARIVTVKNYTNGVLIKTDNYTYAPNQYTCTYSTGSSHTYHLNAAGYVIDVNGAPYPTYTYDSEGHLTKLVYAPGVDEQTYTYTAGNRTAAIIIDSAITANYTYTYLTDKIDYRDYGMPFKGTRDKNLRLQETVSGTGIDTDTITYTYEYDEQGRITKQTSTRTSGGGSEMTFSYFD